MNDNIVSILNRLISVDDYLKPYATSVQKRLEKIRKSEMTMTQGNKRLEEIAAGHEYFGLHFRGNEWIFREWAPNATHIYLIGEMTDWNQKPEFLLERIGSNGVWEIRLPAGAIEHGHLYRLRIHWHHGTGDRIPAYARRVVQDLNTLIFNAQVWHPDIPYRWECHDFNRIPDSPLIYEVHVGMAQEFERIGTYKEFTDRVLPRIHDAGYNTIQLMAIQEHPYYASFGYQVANFFAAASRFGTPEELKELIDTAHHHGISVIMDLIHSHAAANEVEGISCFDGTPYQYFHEGSRGIHLAWGSRCFDYSKPEVLHFLLSNCRFWLDEYHMDGFRFDGITSMMYRHHGLEKAFTSYEDYFNDDVDEDALAYLALANKMIHSVRPDAITIAEDVSGMPMLAVPISQGGIGFDYRFAMGVPDYWIKLAKDTPDEYWDIGHLWYELTNRRKDEKTISYAESHDQALVGDQTLIFRLIGEDMYAGMHVDHSNYKVDRGIALHKMIRLITMATAGNGYLNFMGNEFGHPEWIDFPREGNAWSFRYARRQWSLMDDSALKFHALAQFDRDMIELAKTYRLLDVSELKVRHEHSQDKVIVFERANLIFVFNFHPTQSYVNYCVDILPGKYTMGLDSDAQEYSGHGRLIPGQHHLTMHDASTERHYLSLYLPNRTAFVLQREKYSL